MSLSPCSVPGHKPSFTLEENEMELGLGQSINCEEFILTTTAINLDLFDRYLPRYPWGSWG